VQCAKKLKAASSSEFPTPAARPLYSVLNCERFETTFNLRIPDWEESLKLAMGGIGSEGVQNAVKF
jgi:dTDP-4-dehydrorhamnose reductase